MAIKDCNIEPSDNPALDGALASKIEPEMSATAGSADSMEWDDFLTSIGEDPDSE